MVAEVHAMQPLTANPELAAELESTVKPRGSPGRPQAPLEPRKPFVHTETRVWRSADEWEAIEGEMWEEWQAAVHEEEEQQRRAQYAQYHHQQQQHQLRQGY